MSYLTRNKIDLPIVDYAVFIDDQNTLEKSAEKFYTQNFASHFEKSFIYTKETEYIRSSPAQHDRSERLSEAKTKNYANNLQNDTVRIDALSSRLDMIRKSCTDCPFGVRVFYDQDEKTKANTNFGVKTEFESDNPLVLRLWPMSNRFLSDYDQNELLIDLISDNQEKSHLLMNSMLCTRQELSREVMWAATFVRNDDESDNCSEGVSTRDRRFHLYIKLVRLWKWFKHQYYYCGLRYISEYTIQIVAYVTIFRGTDNGKYVDTSKEQEPFDPVNLNKNLSIWGAFWKSLHLFIHKYFLDSDRLMDPCPYLMQTIHHSIDKTAAEKSFYPLFLESFKNSCIRKTELTVTAEELLGNTRKNVERNPEDFMNKNAYHQYVSGMLDFHIW